MRLLVLGGNSFVGRTVVSAAIERGWSVTTFNRGRRAWAHPDAERRTGDRLDPAGLAQLDDGAWDAVVDTWQGAPTAVRDSAKLLTKAAGRYLYLSSRAVYALPAPPGLDESCATVQASPDDGDGEYAQNKRGAELAVQSAFGDRGLLARAGLILGPHENKGRLPHWFRRAEAGGDLFAPGPADHPFQIIDARDVAAWLLDAAEAKLSGPFNVAAPVGHATTQTFLEAVIAATGSKARLQWISPEAIEAAGIDRWTDLPGWIPPGPELAGLYSTNVDRALATGLNCRPIDETVADTWAWLNASNGPA